MKSIHAALIILIGVCLAFMFSTPFHEATRLFPDPKVIDAALETDAGYRICTDGTQFKVQRLSYLGGWSDDVWGRYFQDIESAKARIKYLQGTQKAPNADALRKFVPITNR